MAKNSVHILLIDDDIIVHKALKRVLKEKEMGNPLLTAKNGEEGLEALKDPKGPAANGLPILIILDLSMPKMDGHEFLKKMRSDPKLNSLPVFILTTSKTPRDMGQAYDMGVIGYIIKEDLSESLEKALTVLEQEWRFD